MRVEEHLGTLRQGLARLIDRYAEGLLDTHACAPRLLRLRQRIGPLDDPRRQLVDAAALHTALRLIIGRLEDCATTVHAG
jgi:hypothetical protein